LIVPRNERQHLADVNHTDTNNKRDVTEKSKKPYNYAYIHTGVVPRYWGHPIIRHKIKKRDCYIWIRADIPSGVDDKVSEYLA